MDILYEKFLKINEELVTSKEVEIKFKLNMLYNLDDGATLSLYMAREGMEYLF